MRNSPTQNGFNIANAYLCTSIMFLDSLGARLLSLFSFLKTLQRFQKRILKAAEAALSEEERGICAPPG